MAEVALNLKDKTLDQKAELVDVLKGGMTGNAVYPTPNPSLVALDALKVAALDKKAAAAIAKNAWRNAVNEQDVAEAELDEGLRQEGLYIQTASGGDKDKIESSGANVKKTGTDKPVPTKVQNVSLSHGDGDGDVDIHWNALKGFEVKSYQYRYSDTVGQPVENWHMGEEITSKTTLKNQQEWQAGQRIWVEVRAVNAAGHGPWSDPATIVVD